MAKRTQRRDRASRRPQAPPQRKITPAMIAGVAAVVILVVAAVVVFAQQQAAPPPAKPVEVTPQTDLGYPVGTTAEGYPFKGDPNAKVTIDEYSDYQCPICAQYHADVIPKVDEQFVKTGKVKFVFKDFAFIGDESKLAANAGLCANEQGKFWQYNDLLFKNQGPENEGTLTRAKLDGFATGLGLDMTKFGDCVSSNKYGQQINRSTQEGKNQGVNGTPTTFVNGRMMEGVDFDSLAAAVNLALGQTK